MVSNEFIDECKNRANANRLGQIIVDGIETPINQSNNLQSIEVDSGCYVDGNIIGSVYAKCLKAKFIADQNNLTDKSIQAQIGVKYADLSTEYINIGKYKVERPNNEITSNMSQIMAYSDLYTNLDNKYVCNIDYSNKNITVSDLYIDVCNQLGLIPVTTEFINSTIPIKANPFTNGEKNRTVLQTICKISCSFIDIDSDTNKIDLCWLSQNEEPDYIFYKNDYVNVEGGQVVCGPINCLIIKNSQIDDENVTIKDDESIALYGEHSITISEDYILYNSELRQQAITYIWNRVKGIKYVDCKLTTYYGKPFLKLGDKIRIYISETEYFDTYVLKHNFTYDGAFESIIESPALTEQEIKNKQDISIGKLLSNTRIDVNKQEKRIEQVVSETKENTETITNITTTKKTITDKEIYIDDAVNTNALKNVIYGKCEQATRSGKNLVDFANTSSVSSGVTCTFENDILIVNQTESGAYKQTIYNILDIVKNNAGKTLKFRYESIDISEFTSSNNQIVQIMITNNGTNSYYLLLNKDEQSKTYTIPNDVSNITYAYLRILTNNSSTEVDKSKVIINKPMLLFSTDVDEPYEPYGTMPSPEYPSEINTIKGIENLLNNKSGIIKAYASCEYYVYSENKIKITSKGTWSRVHYKISNLKANTKYTLSANIINSAQINAGLYESDSNRNIGSELNSYRKLTITSNENGEVDFQLWSNWSSTSSTNVVEFTNLQLEEGTIAHPFVPFGHWLVEKITGKNLFKPTLQTTTVNGINCTDNGDGTYTLNGTATDNTSIDIFPDVAIPSGTYKLNGCPSGGSATTYYLIARFDGVWGDKDIGSGAIFNSTSFGKLSISIRSGVVCNNLIFKPMITSDTSLTYNDFEPYKENTVLTDLNIYDNEGKIIGHHELCSKEDIEDELDVTTGLLTKRILKVVLDGSETITTRSNTSATHNKFVFANILPYETRNSISLIISHFETNNKANTADASINCICSNSSSNYKKYLYVSIEKSIASTVNELKTWLSNNPVTVYYVLAEPQTIQLTPKNVTLFEGVNHISLVDDLETNITLDYLVKTLLSDTYYSKTEAKAEIDIAANEIKQQVSEISNETTKLNQQIQTVDESVSTISTNLNNNYLTSDEINAQMKTNKDDISHLQQQMSEISQTVSDYNINFSTMAGTIKEMNYNFNTDRLQIAKSDDPINSTFDNKGVKIFNYSTLTTIFSDKGTGVDKLIVTGSAQIGYLKFVKNYKNGKKCTTIHVLDKLIEDLSDLESD